MVFFRALTPTFTVFFFFLYSLLHITIGTYYTLCRHTYAAYIIMLCVSRSAVGFTTFIGMFNRFFRGDIFATISTSVYMTGPSFLNRLKLNENNILHGCGECLPQDEQTVRTFCVSCKSCRIQGGCVWWSHTHFNHLVSFLLSSYYGL